MRILQFQERCSSQDKRCIKYFSSVHLSKDKLYMFLRKACPDDTAPKTLQVLEDLTKRCDHVNEFSLVSFDSKYHLQQKSCDSVRRFNGYHEYRKSTGPAHRKRINHD